MKDLVQAFVKEAVQTDAWNKKPGDYASAQDILDLGFMDRIEIIPLLMPYLKHNNSNLKICTSALINQLLRKKMPFEDSHLQEFFKHARTQEYLDSYYGSFPAKSILTQIMHFQETNTISSELEGLLREFLERIGKTKGYNELPYGKAANTEIQLRLKKILGEDESIVLIDEGELWSDLLLNELKQTSADKRKSMGCLIEKANTATSSNPSKKWLKEAKIILDENESYFSDLFISFLNEACKGGKHEIDSWLGASGLIFSPTNSQTLKGLIWISSQMPSSEMALAIGNLARYCFTKISGYGDIDTKCGNACMAALSLMPLAQAITQISLMKNKFKKPSQIKQADKALKNAAKLAGMTESDLLEISVPDYGLKSGEKIIKFGDKSVRVYVSKTDAKMEWRSGEKIVKSIPASVKSDFSAELKLLKANVKEMSSVLSSEKLRLESLLKLPKDWDYKIWSERYLNHPLIQEMVKRMIWTFIKDNVSTAVMFINNSFVNCSGELVAISEEVKVAPWHPINSTADEVLSWRNFLQENQITQPFKQAHREIYVLTDAERQTDTYSNRFAAHIIKQNQFRALLEHRRWKAGGIIGGWDPGDTTCSQEIPEYDLRAELWIDGGDISDTNDMGIYMYVVTDQVRFYKTGSREPMRLEDVPALALSETMRDVDLFVGVTSVGNDPNWGMRDHNNYWQDYSFGELSVSAESRKTILETLLPSLKIAKQCKIDGRFLKVTGKLKTYKIHLGSGNILMEPNDEYLCIVQDAKKNKDDVYLPFEGDRMFSIILSKAIMLANDSKIKDPTIISQIK